MFSKWKKKSYKVSKAGSREHNEDRIVMYDAQKSNHQSTLDRIKNHFTKKVSVEENTAKKIEENVQIEKKHNVEEEEVQVMERREGVRGDLVMITEEIKSYPKTKEEETLIKTAITNNEFLKNILKDPEIDQITNVMALEEISANQMLTAEGKDGDKMYISASGEFEIIIAKKVQEKFSDNRVFGELAILYNTPRFATIKALISAKVWVLNRNVYKAIIRKTAMDEEKERLEFLKSTPILSKASDVKLNAIATLFHEGFYKSGEVIVKQGDVGDNFFIVKSGKATVSIEGKGEVAVLARGEYFGEKALLEDELRQATVTANKPGVECLVLSRLDFNNYLGDLSTFLEKEEVDEGRKSSCEQAEYQKAELDDFKVVRLIGVGGFGEVQLVKNIHDGRLLAMKRLPKHNLVKNGNKEQAYNERGIQIRCTSAFIVNLYRTFEDTRYLYFLLECCLGGDLFGLMFRQKNRCFEESGAKFISACILEALDYLHKRNVAYLDLKPENVLIDKRGYAKLADFGNSVFLPNNSRTFIFAGTAEYVAPEIIYERGHGKSSDCWAFGIFIYELLVGRTPFYTNDPTYMKTYKLILKGIDEVNFSGKVSKHAESLIKKLCSGNHIRRLGCQRHGFDDVRKQKWFQHFNWEDLGNMKMVSPYVPDLDGDNDTKFFEVFKGSDDVHPEYEMWGDF